MIVGNLGRIGRRAMAIERLGATGWLGQTPSRFRDLVLSRGVTVMFRKGEWIYHFGGEPGGLWGVAEGGIELESTLSGGAPRMVAFASTGFWSGEASLITNSPRAVGLRATCPTVMMHLSQPAFMSIAQEDPEAWRWVALLTLHHLDGMMGFRADLMHPNSRLRVMAVLLRLCDTSWSGTRIVTDEPVSIDQSQEVLAEHCNVSRSLLATILASLRDEGAVELGYRRIDVLRPGMLRAALT